MAVKDPSPQRILIINPFGIGDVLFTTPLIRAVRQVFPESHLGYVCNRRTESILRNNPHLNELYIYERDEIVQLWRKAPWQTLRQVGKLLWRIRARRFDLAIDLSLSERYSLILKVFGVRRLVGFDYRHRGRFLSEALAIDGYQQDHVVEHYRRLLRFLGIHLVDATLEFNAAPEDDAWVEAWLVKQGITAQERLVGLVPAGGVSWGIDAPFRRWSDAGFAEVADSLAAIKGVRVILFGEAADRSACAAVARRMQGQVLNVSGQTTLGQFVSFLKRLSLVVCNDGGPLHLAVSQKIKSVSIFGPVDPNVYGPYSPRGQDHRVIYNDQLPCRPCYHQFRLPPCPYERACLRTIEPEDVLAACEELLAESR